MRGLSYSLSPWEMARVRAAAAKKASNTHFTQAEYAQAAIKTIANATSTQMLADNPRQLEQRRLRLAEHRQELGVGVDRRGSHGEQLLRHFVETVFHQSPPWHLAVQRPVKARAVVMVPQVAKLV